MAAQNLPRHPTSSSKRFAPYSYVYSPITLPLLRLIGKFPVWLSGTGYWLVLIAGVLSVLWGTTRPASRSNPQSLDPPFRRPLIPAGNVVIG
jgi:hypothetical protein